MPRIFVEWFDEARPGWGLFITSEDREFQQVVEEGFAEFGPPTKVEFRVGYTVSEPLAD